MLLPKPPTIAPTPPNRAPPTTAPPIEREELVTELPPSKSSTCKISSAFRYLKIFSELSSRYLKVFSELSLRPLGILFN